MEVKYNHRGQRIYPMTPEEEKIYNRLMREYPEFQTEIEHELTSPTEKRNWKGLEDAIKYLW